MGTDDKMKILEMAASVETLIDEMREMNADDSPIRSRQLSLAITKLQEGSHWLTDYMAEAF